MKSFFVVRGSLDKTIIGGPGYETKDYEEVVLKRDVEALIYALKCPHCGRESHEEPRLSDHMRSCGVCYRKLRDTLSTPPASPQGVRYRYEYSPANKAYEIAPIGPDGELDWERELCITAQDDDESQARLIVDAVNAYLHSQGVRECLMSAYCELELFSAYLQEQPLHQTETGMARKQRLMQLERVIQQARAGLEGGT